MGYNTVSQLINRLREFPEDAIVLVKDQSTNSFQYFDGMAVREFDQQKNICIIDITSDAAKISFKALERGWRPHAKN